MSVKDSNIQKKANKTKDEMHETIQVTIARDARSSKLWEMSQT